MDVRVGGRVAVITGASTGLGPAMAKAEVTEAAGKTNAKIEAWSCYVALRDPFVGETRVTAVRSTQRWSG